MRGWLEAIDSRQEQKTINKGNSCRPTFFFEQKVKCPYYLGSCLKYSLLIPNS